MGYKGWEVTIACGCEPTSWTVNETSAALHFQSKLAVQHRNCFHSAEPIKAL